MIAEFLLARIAEDEQTARPATGGTWKANIGAFRMASIVSGDVWIGDIDHDPDAVHVARHDPARVLKECEAKRRIVERHKDCGTGYGYCDDGGHGWGGDLGLGCDDLADLALPYAAHPDCRPEWAPDA